MDIRVIDETTMPALWQLWVRAVHDHPTAFGATYEWAKDVAPEKMQEIFRNNRAGGGFMLGAVEQGEMIGMVMFTREQGEKFQHKGDIGAMYVTPEQRGKGVAKALLLTVLEKTRTMSDLVLVSLMVNAENTSAIQLYEGCGFKAWGIQPNGLRFNGEYYGLMQMSYERT